MKAGVKMKIIRFKTIDKGCRLGFVKDDSVWDLTSVDKRVFSSFLSALKEAHVQNINLDELIREAVQGCTPETYALKELDHPRTPLKPHIVIPYPPPEVWGCGVTYARSVKAREVETSLKGAYDRVYEAERPEVFFKATRTRCVGPYEAICVRGDSKSTVPEAELAFILGYDREIVAYTVGNDVTARDIEGVNPLYLPQAKIYSGCCAVGPAVVTCADLKEPRNLKVECRIHREGGVVFQGATSTAQLRRSLEELRGFLCRDNPVPAGTVCLTGTGIVPPDEFTLCEGDVVEIGIEGIGTLRNPVKRL